MSAKRTVLLKKVDTFKKALLKSGKAKYLVLGLAVIVLAGLAFVFKSLFVAAIVNGKPISRVSLIKEMEKSAGSQTLENLVMKELIFQEAKKQNISVASEEIQGQIDELTKSVEAQGMTLDSALAMQGVKRQDLEENIRIQKTIEKVLGAQIELSEDEVKKYFEENKNLYSGSNYEDVKPNIEQELKQEKMSSKFQEWMQKVRTESNILYFVEFN